MWNKCDCTRRVLLLSLAYFPFHTCYKERLWPHKCFSLSTEKYTTSHLSKQCHSKVRYRKAANWLFCFLHRAFHLFPQQPLSLPILHILLPWMEPSPDAHCRSDHELLSSGYSKLEEGWENSYEGPHNSTHSRNRQLKIKENAFSLAICFGR